MQDRLDNRKIAPAHERVKGPRSPQDAALLNYKNAGSRANLSTRFGWGRPLRCVTAMHGACVRHQPGIISIGHR